MKQSPVQLVDAVVEQLMVRANSKYQEPDDQILGFEDVTLEFQFGFEPLSGYWAEEGKAAPTLEDRTYRVVLGVRSPKEGNVPYIFMIVCSGIVVCLADKIGGNMSSEGAAEEYGYSLLYGMAREQLLALTSRMKHGARMLPTMSFMGHRVPRKKAEDTKVEPPSVQEG
jgi:hypothetical protein